ncbi:endonuclease/exonuclease/phosphatase family protein [Falsiroseomonas sp. HW251]|uniref:endonuclease/exonuclease/phosphatase family protein n=1 Tax=Falsiroseomonas sp. HW251 TaxID=3390998 RepID=UPI003D3152C6
MRVATWNVHRGRGPFGLFRPGRIAAVIAAIAPDLIALQEAQHYVARGRDMLDFARIGREAGLLPLDVAGARGWRSNVVLVRRDVDLRFGPAGLRLGGLEPRGAILAEVDLGAGPFRLIACHLSLGAARRRAQAALLLDALRTGGGPGLPTLLLGDLNEWRPDRSALSALRPEFGPGCALATFPSFRPALPLDHLLCRPAGLLSDVAVHDSPLARRASDHLPLVGCFHPAAQG